MIIYVVSKKCPCQLLSSLRFCSRAAVFTGNVQEEMRVTAFDKFSHISLKLFYQYRRFIVCFLTRELYICKIVGPVFSLALTSSWVAVIHIWLDHQGFQKQTAGQLAHLSSRTRLQCLPRQLFPASLNSFIKTTLDKQAGERLHALHILMLTQIRTNS